LLLYGTAREVIETIGLFDPRCFLDCEEIEHYRRVREVGCEVIYYPHTQVAHVGEFIFIFSQTSRIGWLVGFSFVTLLTDAGAALKRPFQPDTPIERKNRRSMHD
jgi:hypothetical protein